MPNRTDHQRRVDMFMQLAGQERPWSPCIPSEEVRRLRATLILEEALETARALGFTPYMKGFRRFGIFVDELELAADFQPNLVEIADGCADISVVTIGTLSACGIADRPLLEEVDRSNLAKFQPGYTIREDGKLIKPPGWTPPDIARVLEDQRNGMVLRPRLTDDQRRAIQEELRRASTGRIDPEPV